jgi:hypothetical protein
MVSKRLAVLLAIISCSTAFADNLYRYKNNEGGTVVDWHVPAKFAGRGYEVLSPLGEVIKVVPRQLSDSQLNDKDLKALRDNQSPLGTSMPIALVAIVH